MWWRDKGKNRIRRSLWALLTPDEWDTLQRTGSLVGAQPEDLDHRMAVEWLKGQMAKRIKGYRGGHPILAWYQPKSDIRKKGFLPESTEAVRVDLRARIEDVLLFDHDAWVAGPVSCAFLALSEREHDRRAKEGRLMSWRWENWPPPEKHQEKELTESWERMFDLEIMQKSWYGADAIRAAMERIDLSQVTGTKRFKTR